MKILVVDDEKLALEGAMEAVACVAPEAKITGIRSAEDALDYMGKNPDCQVAFLDIEMRGMNGITLAKKLKVKYPKLNIIFTTGYSEYTGDAFSLHASGYVLKPITPEKVKKELMDLRSPLLVEDKRMPQVRTFGNFEVFLGENPLNFKYSKTKELLAYLIDKRGAMCTNREICTALWEEEEFGSRKSYLQNIRSDLWKTLKKSGMAGILVRKRGGLGIAVNQVHCDYYDWLDGKPAGLNAYRGEYMNQYSWAEETHGALEREA